MVLSIDISYSNTRFNDDFNTQPEEKISLLSVWIILAFLDMNSQRIYFKEAGNLNYGL